MTGRIAGALLLLAALLPAQRAFAAAGSATVQTFDADGNSVTVRIEGLDGNHLRLSSQQFPEAYLVWRNGRAYSVIQFGSLPLVMDTNEMAAQMGADRMPAAPAPADDIRTLVSLTPTGCKETVAGIVGEIVLLKYVDGTQTPREEQIVVAKDQLLHDLSLALYELGKVLSGAAGIRPPDGSERLARELSLKGLGLLRMGTRLQLLALDRSAPPASRFELPAEPMQAFPPLGR